MIRLEVFYLGKIPILTFFFQLGPSVPPGRNRKLLVLQTFQQPMCFPKTVFILCGMHSIYKLLVFAGNYLFKTRFLYLIIICNLVKLCALKKSACDLGCYAYQNQIMSRFCVEQKNPRSSRIQPGVQ